MQLNKAVLLTSCLLLSVLVHILFFYAWLISGTYNFSAPVNHAQWVEVNLAQQTSPPSLTEKTEDVDTSDTSEQGTGPEVAQPAPRTVVATEALMEQHLERKMLHHLRENGLDDVYSLTLRTLLRENG